MYDAGGAEVATYKKLVQVPNDVYALQHHTLYGAGRVGLLDKTTGKAMYELNDHLGNVRAVVTASANGAAETISYTDYYPHGGVMPSRTYQSSLNFPYGYQGQEKDGATGLTNFELRQYDPRIGRWYNPDPMGQHHSPYLAMSNNPVSFTDPDGGWDGDGGINDGFAQAVQTTENWMRMTPADRRAYQAANGTDYAGQFRDKVFDLAFVGGYEDQDGHNWYYSARKNDIGAWMKMYDSNPFGYYRTASGDGQFKAGASWINATERFVGLGYNGEFERMKWAQRTYGGTGDGSILDQLHQSFSMFNTKWNPVAHLVNGIDGVAFGTDRFGNQQSGMQTAIQLASGITGVFGEGIANGIVSKLGVMEFNAATNGSQVVNESLALIGCFVKGTKVWSEKGLVNIENVEVGDMIFSYDIKNDKIVSKVVSKAYERKIKGLIKLEFGNEVVYTTSEHPFYVDKTWIEASKLKKGDLLFSYDKSFLVLEKIAVIDTIVKVYNFTVEDEHNYFVGESKILVHNNPCGPVTLADLIKLNGGKNSVTIETATQKIRYDLAGKAHGGVPTPHMQIYNKNFINGVQRNVSRASKDAIPMTQTDFDFVWKFLTNTP